MIHELFTMNFNWGLVIHHAVTILICLTLNEPSISYHVSSVYYISTLASIVMGTQCMAFLGPAYIVYHLYPNSSAYQFASYVWILVVKILIVMLFFISIPIYLVYGNFDKISSATFWILFLVVSFNIMSEFFVLSIQLRVGRRKYASWKIENVMNVESDLGISINHAETRVQT